VPPFRSSAQPENAGAKGSTLGAGLEMPDLRVLLATTCTAVAMAAGVRARRAAVPKLERRDVLLTCALPVIAFGDIEAATARQGYGEFNDESNKIAYLTAKAKTLNNGVSMYLFDVLPTIFPSTEQGEIPEEKCKELGVNCPTVASMTILKDMYQLGRGGQGGAVSVVPVERELIYPMKDISLAPIVDPDTGEELREIFQKFEISQGQLARAAAKKDLPAAREAFNAGRLRINEFFEKVNTSLNIPPNTDLFFVPMPTDLQVIEDTKYWQRRKEKWEVKKKVDAVSKANKTARFYAKSIFGKDAESWDSRGDRAKEFLE